MDYLSLHDRAPFWLCCLNIVVFILCLWVNFTVGRKGSGSNEAVSAKYKLAVTPPGFTFGTIWSLIYLLHLAILAYVTINRVWPSQAHVLLIIISVLNPLWVYVFSFGNKTALLVCELVIVGMAFVLFKFWHLLVTMDAEGSWWTFMRNFSSMYLGWVLTANLLNLGTVLVYLFGLSQTAFTRLFWLLAPSMYIGATYLINKNYGAKGVSSAGGLWFAAIWAMSGALISTVKNKVD